MRSYWDIGEVAPFPNLGKTSIVRVMRTLIILGGQILHIEVDQDDDALDHHRYVLYRISLPLGKKDEFEELAGYRLVSPLKLKGHEAMREYWRVGWCQPFPKHDWLQTEKILVELGGRIHDAYFPSSGYGCWIISLPIGKFKEFKELSGYNVSCLPEEYRFEDRVIIKRYRKLLAIGRSDG